MFKSFFAALAIVLASVFGGHYTNTISRQPAAPVAAVPSIQTPTNMPSSPPVLPRPHLFPLAGALSGQSTDTHAAANLGAVLGTSTEETYVTQDQLAAQIEQAANALRSLIYQNDSAPNSLPASGGYTNEIALSNNIDNLSGSSNGPLTISDATLNNISGLTAAEIPTDIVAANYLPLAGGTLTGSLSIPTLFASTTSYTNFFATNASTTNATSTSLFSAVASFTSVIIDSLSAATASITGLTATNSTTTNATTTNLYSATATIPSLTATNATTTAFAITGTANALLSTNSAGSVGPTTVGNGLTYSGGTLSTSFGPTTANIWTALQQFQGNASTTQLSAGLAYFGTTATSSFASNGVLTLAQALAVGSGGTGSTTTIRAAQRKRHRDIANRSHGH